MVIITIIMILMEKRAMLLNFYLTDDFPALLRLEHPRENWRSQRMKQLMSDEWWQVRLRWCGDDHLDSSGMVGGGRFFYYHGESLMSSTKLIPILTSGNKGDSVKVLTNGRLCRKGRSHLTRNSIFAGPSARRSALWDLILVRSVCNFAISHCETCTKLRPLGSWKINPSVHVFCIQD